MNAIYSYETLNSILKFQCLFKYFLLLFHRNNVYRKQIEKRFDYLQSFLMKMIDYFYCFYAVILKNLGRATIDVRSLHKTVSI